MRKRPARLIHSTRTLLLFALMWHVLQWRIPEFGTKSLWTTEFRSRGCLMRVVPKVMRGAFRTALRLSFKEAAEARAAGNVKQEIRARKFFMLVPRMLLTKPPRGGAVSKAKLAERCDAFARGDWMLLVKASRADAQSNSTATPFVDAVVRTGASWAGARRGPCS